MSDEDATTPVSVHDLDLPELPMEIRQMERGESARVYQSIAQESWIARSVIGYSVLQYDDVASILRDKRWHNAVAKMRAMMGITDPFFTDRAPSILSAEGDVHVRLRRLVAKAFSPREADRLRPFMRRVMNDLIDPVASAGRADLTADICEPYPIPIICELLGAPSEDWQLFSRWAEDVLRIFNGTAPDELDVIKKAQLELNDYVRGMIDRRRSDPREDLITQLIAAEEEGDRLSTDELVMMVNAVIVGGTDTTRNQLACALGVFSDHPDQWALLAERPELAPQAVEEVMRLSTTASGRHSHAQNCRKHCRSSRSGCRTSPSTVRSRGSHRPLPSSAPTTSPSRSPLRMSTARREPELVGI